MYYSKQQREAMASAGKADKVRQDFLSIAVNGIENVKGLALEPGLKEAWRDIEANYIINAEKMQKAVKNSAFRLWHIKTLKRQYHKSGYGTARATRPPAFPRETV